MKNITKNALINAVATVAYISLLVSGIFYAPRFLGEVKETIFVPILMLMIFVFSAAVTGSLVLGKPILWYFEDKKKEAFSLLTQTLGFLLVIIAIVATVILCFGRV